MSGAVFVAAGIFLSRISGLVRERAFAAFFGNSDAADAFKAALKIPNFLQNLFGEGVLSASFIPAYAGLLAKGDEAEAKRLAGAVASWLALAVSTLALLGAWATPALIDLIAPGFADGKRALTVDLVRLFFPGTALLAMSAWCLGILNSHRRFFLPYVAPVLWNAAIVGAIVIASGALQGVSPTSFDEASRARLAVMAGWGLVAGSALQLLVQLPSALKCARGFAPSLKLTPGVRGVFLAFGPVVLARGVVQVSAYVDNWLASWLPSGSVSTLAYAQTIYVLPVSLFGMSVAAASLPEMSGRAALGGGGLDETASAALRAQLERGFSRIAFFVVPSTVAFLVLGDWIAAALFQTGQFGRDDAVWVWSALAGSAVGLLSGTLGRLCASAFYAMKDTKTPFRLALVRVALTTSLGYVGGLMLPGWLGFDAKWGVAGLTASAGAAGWVEFLLLRSKLRARIGRFGLGAGRLARLWASACGAGAVSFALGRLAPSAFPTAWHALHPAAASSLSLVAFALAYGALALALRAPEASDAWSRLRRRSLK